MYSSKKDKKKTWMTDKISYDMMEEMLEVRILPATNKLISE